MGRFEELKAFDLIPRALYHWRENPLSGVLWRKLRPAAFWIAGASLAQVILYRISELLGGAGLAAVPMGIGAALSYAMVAGLVAAPPIYAGWAYRRGWAENSEFQALPLTFEERIYGIFVPAFAAMFVYLIPGVVNNLIELLIWMIVGATSSEMPGTS